MTVDNSDGQGLTSKIYIPHFNPESSKITARTWIAFVELARTSAGMKTVEKEITREKRPRENNEDGTPKMETIKETSEEPRWSEQQTCTNAMLLLQGTAAKWIEHILETQGDEMKSWTKFKASFKERFVRSLTLTEKMNLRDLRMSSTESCRDFYDRCNNNLNLFYDDEWETIVPGETVMGFPWENPSTTATPVMMTEVHDKRSKIYYEKARTIELRLAFASGLRESIKKQVLFQESTTVQEILKIAQRVESGLKELKKSDIASVAVDENEEEEVDVGAVNFRKKGRKQLGAGKFGKTPFKCFYCHKPGHYKNKCITMRNDRNKGIYKPNINGAPRANANAVDAEDDEEDEEESPSVNNCQVDLAQMLNYHSA